MAKWIFNDSGGDKTWAGQLVSNQAYYQLQPHEETTWANTATLLTDIGNADAVVSTTNASGGHLGVTEGINHLKDLNQEFTVKNSPPFADKTIGAKSLFSRMTGKKFASLSVGSNDLLFTIPYATMKFNGVEIINSEVGDKVDLYVLDSTTGTYTGTNNLVLNQFGFTVYPSADYYDHHSNYDADLFINMQVKAVYDSVSAKDVYINYILHELK